MKRLVLSTLSSLSYVFLAPFAYAADTEAGKLDPCESAGTFKALCSIGTSGGITVGNVLGAFITLLFVLAVIIAVLYLILGGIKWITSRGDKTEVETARNHIMAAVVGLIVVFLTFFIINFVLNFLLGKSLSELDLPKLKETTTEPAKK